VLSTDRLRTRYGLPGAEYGAALRHDEGVLLLIGLNAVLALLLELALLVAAVGIGLRAPVPLAAAVVLAVVLPIAVIVLWGLLLAPRARRRLGPRARLLTETALFAAAAGGLAATGAAAAGIALAIAAAIRLVLGAALGRV
jgi:hypothetical protein